VGKTNREIADALVLSVLTVNKHVENIMTKAGVARRTELVAYAERIGLRQAVDS
jgi:DNA-binding NarL/FixJ family response regulator